MNEDFKSLILFLDVEGLLELFNICNMRFFEMYVNGNDEYASRYNDIFINIREELKYRGIWK